jgi:ParB-like chromosome segregation protein Spo0J
VNIEKLKEHEDVDLKHFKKLLEKIKSDGILKRPIVVDKNTKVVLDGEHRLRVLKEMGYDKIPAILVDYSSPKNNGLTLEKRGKNQQA